VRPGRAADHSPPSSAAVMEEYSYTSTRPLGHTGPVTESLYLYLMFTINCHKIQVLQTKYRRYKESKLWFLYYSEACSSRNGLEIYKKSDKTSIPIQHTYISLGMWNFIGCEEPQR